MSKIDEETAALELARVKARHGWADVSRMLANATEVVVFWLTCIAFVAGVAGFMIFFHWTWQLAFGS